MAVVRFSDQHELMVCRINPASHSFHFSYYWKWVQIVTRQNYIDFPRLFFASFLMKVSFIFAAYACLLTLYSSRSFRDVSENNVCPRSQGTTACICSILLVLGGEGLIYFVWLLLTSMVNFLVVLILPRAFLLFCGFDHLWSLSVFSCMFCATLSDLITGRRHGRFLEKY